MLMVTAITTLITVYFAGHLTDRLGRMQALGLSGFAIAIALFLFGYADRLGATLVIASVLLGFGWSLYYALSPVVLTRITAPAERVRFFRCSRFLSWRDLAFRLWRLLQWRTRG